MDLNNALYYTGSITVFLMDVIILVLTIVCGWRIFTKAGEEGWKAIIPCYNVYIIFKITWGTGWKFLYLLVPFLNIYAIIKTCILLAKAFGKSGWFAFGLVMVPHIMGLILAFSDCEYLGVPGAKSQTATTDTSDYAYESSTSDTSDKEE